MARSTAHRTTTTTNPGALTTTPMSMSGTRAAKRPPRKSNNATTKQYLSLDRTTANEVITKELTAGRLASFVNALCAVDAKTAGGIAQDPTWAYNLGVQMFSGD